MTKIIEVKESSPNSTPTKVEKRGTATQIIAFYGNKVTPGGDLYARTLRDRPANEDRIRGLV